MQSDDDHNTIAELEHRHEQLHRKAKRKPSWRRARDSVAEKLVEAKRERIDELEQELPDDNMSPAATAAVAQLQGATGRTDVAELRKEQERHRSDIAELERQS